MGEYIEAYIYQTWPLRIYSQLPPSCQLGDVRAHSQFD